MATKVFMEALSPTMEEGRLVKWHKRDGDAVKTGETLAEVETDKAVMELVARADGVLRQVAGTEGQTVPVGNVVAVIAAPGESPDVPAATSPRPAPTPAVRSGERGAVLVAAAPRPTPTAPGHRARADEAPRLQRLVSRRSHPLLDRGPYRGGGGGRGRAHHTGDPQRGPEAAARDRARSARARREGAEPPAAAERVHGGDVLRLEPRDVRDRPVHGGDQSTGSGHHRGAHD